MRIIPVIDLMGDTVVHAIAGQRSAYRPVQSVLASQSTPDGIGRALSQTFQATSVYVADLDAIAGADPAWTAYRQIARCGSTRDFHPLSGQANSALDVQTRVGLNE